MCPGSKKFYTALIKDLNRLDGTGASLIPLKVDMLSRITFTAVGRRPLSSLRTFTSTAPSFGEQYDVVVVGEHLCVPRDKGLPERVLASSH